MGNDCERRPRDTLDVIRVCAAVVSAATAVIRLVIDLKGKKQKRSRHPKV